MKNLCYILGSGIMDDPILFRFCVCLVLALMFSYVSWKMIDRQDKHKMFLVGAFITGIASLCLLCQTCYYLTALEKKETEGPQIEKVEYANHEYLVYKESIIHNPDCPCRKKFWHKEK